MNVEAEDADLIERLGRGDRDALRRIYEKYKCDLLRLGCCLLANWTDAEDCLHDVFVSLAANHARVRHGGNLRGYLATAVANRSRDRIRQRKRGRQTGELDGEAGYERVDPAAEPSAAIIESEEDRRLYLAIAALPSEQRAVVTLRLHGDMTFDEIAAHEGATGNTIRSRYRYALEKLRSSLDVGVKR